MRFEEQRACSGSSTGPTRCARLQVWTNADKPEEAALARRYGAQGIGLCRTEHMFREGERLEIVRDAILVAFEATRAKERRDDGEDADARADAPRSSSSTPPWPSSSGSRRATSAGIFEAMDGLPVVIRLIDPPLHEFLPEPRGADRAGDAARTLGRDPYDPELRRGDASCCAAVEALREQNPMLGLRGCRLGLMIPDFVKMQTRAILNAADRASGRPGREPHAEIMIPLVGHVNELAETRRILEAEAKQVEERGRSRGRLQVRHDDRGAARRAHRRRDRREAEFFSFGTNDLTQMTFGFSRDDAEGSFLLDYVERRILPANPFQTLDTTASAS